ncbi:MAG: DUF4136 domain-containing protein [Steroidobacteraceae bacterium]
MNTVRIRYGLVLGLLAAALLATGCASGPRVRAERDAAIDFSQYRTFAFADPLGTDRAGYQTMVSQHLKAATQRELESRGLRLVEASPQLLVNFNGRLSEKFRTSTVPSSALTLGYGRGYYRYRTGFYTTWPLYGPETRVQSYTEGTLNIDVIDAGKKQMIWEGVAVGRVTDKTYDNLQPEIDAAVAAIFANYPIRSASQLQ